ncbi:MAG: restriction endonuclease subunit S, partial [Endomicrobium sp.]|nr:restriction endonuclease subunit S [Endomicrobium sp.]
PLPEQKRIVKAIEQAFEKITEIETNKKELEELADKVKAKTLGLAIRGKLVSQNPKDEPASVLLEKIKKEKEKLIKAGKIRKEKQDSYIYKSSDNLYYQNNESINKHFLFEIPKGWQIEKLGNVCDISRGGSPCPIQKYLTTSNDGINWIKIGDAKLGSKYITSAKEKIIPSAMEYSRYVKSGDFLLTCSMSFGHPYILKIDGCVHNGWIIIDHIEHVFNCDFLYYALSSDTIYRLFTSLSTGSTVKNLQIDTVKSVCFPIPPLSEQKRIASKIELIFKQIDLLN